MLKLIYDYQIFSWQKYGGVSRYIYELATRLSLDNELNVKILAMIHVNEYLKKCQSPNLIWGFSVPKFPKTGKIRERINYQLSRTWLHFLPPEIIHETFYLSDRLTNKKTKTVLTVHDLIDEKFYPGGELNQRKASAVKRADHIICVSQNTKSDLVTMLDVNPNKISVIYLGSSLSEEASAEQSEQKIFDFPYILYVGDRYGYKNFARFLQAYGNSQILKKDFKVVCFGGYPMLPEELKEAEKIGILPNSLLYFSGDDSLLTKLYQGAAVFVYPSLYEGFGIPPLEAMSLGCPVVCSNTSSIPEVVGEAAEFFDPNNVQNITNALETVLYSNERTKKLSILGKERAKLFSWQKCAEQTKKVYLSLRV